MTTMATKIEIVKEEELIEELREELSPKIEKVEKELKEPVKETEIKELLIGGGAGALAYLAGYCHGLVEIVGKEKLKEYELGCLSAGAIVGLCLHYTVRQDQFDMRYFYNEWIRKCYEKTNKKYLGWFTSGSLLRECSEKLIKLIEDNGLEKVDNKVHMAISVCDGLIPKRRMVSEYKDGKELGQALESTCGIPYLMNFSFFNKFQGKRTLDGGFTGQIPNRYTESQKIMLNIFPKYATRFPFVWKQPKNIQYLHITENSGVKFPFDYWIWDENWADEMFLKGILSAKQEQANLEQLFGLNTGEKTEQKNEKK